jgi:hypothetical protein
MKDADLFFDFFNGLRRGCKKQKPDTIARKKLVCVFLAIVVGH